MNDPKNKPVVKNSHPLLPLPHDLPWSPLFLKKWRTGSVQHAPQKEGLGGGCQAFTPHLHVHLAASPKPWCSSPGFVLQGAMVPFKDCSKDFEFPFCPNMPCMCLLHHHHPIKILFCNNPSKTLPQSWCCLLKHVSALSNSSFSFQLPQPHHHAANGDFLLSALSRDILVPPVTATVFIVAPQTPLLLFFWEAWYLVG